MTDGPVILLTSFAREIVWILGMRWVSLTYVTRSIGSLLAASSFVRVQLKYFQRLHLLNYESKNQSVFTIVMSIKNSTKRDQYHI